MAEVLKHWLAGEKYETTAVGFMSEKWDSFVPGPEVWREVFRVLKPGGHLVAFAGTRTHDLMGIAIRLAGFEKRDLGAWLYFNGFPKNFDASKAIDAMKTNRAEVDRVRAWITEARDAAGVTNKAIDEATGTAGMASHWTKHPTQPSIPSPEQWATLIRIFGQEPSDEIQDLFDLVTRAKGQPGAAWFDRVVTAERDKQGTERIGMPNQPKQLQKTVATTAASEEAQRWAGHGTALKPAQEPWLLFRKPFELNNTTLAENLIKHGTGAINVDGCRFPDGDPMWVGPQDTEPGHPAGRYPANVIHARKPSQAEKQAGCEAIEPVTGAQAVKRKPGSKGMSNPRAGAGRTREELRNDHKTVKPIRLMAWLVRLVTPPGGVVLDPFMGSGTTGIAAVAQGFRFTGIELRERFVDVAGQRIAYWTEHVDEARALIMSDTGDNGGGDE